MYLLGPPDDQRREELVKVLLTEEFGGTISQQLLSAPTAEIVKERNKQVVPKDIVYGCLNAYYNGTQWKMPDICCVCSRRQDAVEIHHISVNAGENPPGYLETLRNSFDSPFPDEEFRFTDACFNELVLDHGGIKDHKCLVVLLQTSYTGVIYRKSFVT